VPILIALLFTGQLADGDHSHHLGAPEPLRESTDVVMYNEGDVTRAVIRLEPSSSDRRTRVLYSDPLTGRSTPATVGREALMVSRAQNIAAVLAAHAVDVVRVLMPSRGIYQIASRHVDEDGADLAARLAPLVRAGVLESAAPDLALGRKLAAIDVPPSDERYGGQYYLEDIQIEGAWALSVGDPSTRIVVVDNGCDLLHRDLASKLDPGRDVINDDDDPTFGGGVGNEHGTACAGLAGAATDNDIDIAGACPECRVACVRMLGEPGELLPVSGDVQAFQFAFESNAAVVSNSWGFVDPIPVPAALRDAIVVVQQDGREGRGAVVVFAAGNDNREPGRDELGLVPGVLGVGAMNNVGEPTQYTNFGDVVDVVTPTGSITLDITGDEGAGPGEVTNTFSGTSSACPIAAGVAGLIASAAPDLTADEINALLIDTAKLPFAADPDAEGHDPHYGFGMVQADKALEIALGIEDGDGGEKPGSPDDRPPPGCSHADGGRQGGRGAVLGLTTLLWLFGRRRPTAA
jgi:subtilisin family serine protease